MEVFHFHRMFHFRNFYVPLCPGQIWIRACACIVYSTEWCTFRWILLWPVILGSFTLFLSGSCHHSKPSLTGALVGNRKQLCCALFTWRMSCLTNRLLLKVECWALFSWDSQWCRMVMRVLMGSSIGLPFSFLRPMTSRASQKPLKPSDALGFPSAKCRRLRLMKRISVAASVYPKSISLHCLVGSEDKGLQTVVQILHHE